MENLSEQKLYEDKIVSTTTTKYQHLTLTHNKMKKGIMKC